MSKLFTSRVALLAFVLLSLVGCQDNQGDDVVSFWAYQPSTQAHQNAFRALIADFTKETGIKLYVALNLRKQKRHPESSECLLMRDYWISIIRFASTLRVSFGTVMVSTPFSILAAISFSSTPSPT